MQLTNRLLSTYKIHVQEKPVELIAKPLDISEGSQMDTSGVDEQTYRSVIDKCNNFFCQTPDTEDHKVSAVRGKDSI